MNACTIIAKNYLPQARVLAKSFRRHHPDGRFVVLVLDEIEGWFDPSQEPFETLTAAELDLPEFGPMASAYDVLEMSTAVKPWLLRQLLGDDDHVIYLDPDIQIFGSCEEVADLARTYSMVLTPHNVAPMPRDGLRPTEGDILIAGAYNLGFLGLGYGEATDEFLTWWSERLLHDCIVDVARGYFVDQRWIDLVPGMIPGVWVLRDPGYNVAYWNLYSRRLAVNGNGGLTVNDLPLRFFHYSGYDPDRPDELSRHQNRVRLVDEPVIKQLCDDYAAALRAEGFDDAKRWPYGYARTASGLQLDRVLRRLYADGLRQGALTESVFDAEGERRFRDWARGPAGDDADPRVNRWMRAMHEARPDLQAAFPVLHSGPADQFLNWLSVHGAREFGEAMAAFGPDPATAPAPAAKGRPAIHLERGVNVVGYLSSELGVGEVGRQVVGALDANGVPLLPIRLVAEASRQGHEFAHVGAMRAPFSVNLLCVNADQTPIVCEQAGPEFFAGRHTIGWWWWEASTFPQEWHDAFRYVDEVWAGSRFVAEAIEAVSPVRVLSMPMPVALPERTEADRAHLRLPDGFVFLFVFDYNSVAARKNPGGLIEAYKRAFARDERVNLVLKCINGDRHRAEHAALRAACAGRPDIVVMDDYLTPADKDTLIASCDCYVSLHRSEGFGITMAEAMLLGKPVVATGYSGNLDFMAADRGYLVDYELVPIGPDAKPYPADGQWAEPDLDHAAAQMRAVVDDPDEAARRAEAGAEWVREHHSRQSAGRAMALRLEQIAHAHPIEGPLPDPELAHAHAVQMAQKGPVRWPHDPRSPKRFVRAAALRAGKPLLTHAQDVNNALLADIDAVARAQFDARAQTLADMRRLERRLEGLEAGNRATERRLRDLVDLAQETQQLLAATYAPPHVEGDPFRETDMPGRGRVLGYSHGVGTTDEYRDFEDTFRGSEDFIRERQRTYLDLVAQRAPVLDAGCGRGEFLDLMRDASIQYMGVDLDEGMVKRCHVKGHATVEHADVVQWLEAAEPGSLGAIFSAQVVEHMPREELLRFLAAARRALRPGGVLIAETVNPHSPAALKAFWVDLTHQLPIFPEVLLQLCRSAGFEEGYAFMPNGSGDYESDRRTAGEYAVVATAAPSD
jgi:glycosyltransferase involved in cell wall biosynthesis/2-polyprenyl-3-methyl-5-hydroxy-6-metoxy-1,4-benzoquinol methylase